MNSFGHFQTLGANDATNAVAAQSRGDNLNHACMVRFQQTGNRRGNLTEFQESGPVRAPQGAAARVRFLRLLPGLLERLCVRRSLF